MWKTAFEKFEGVYFTRSILEHFVPYDIFQVWDTHESNRKIYCDLNGDELEKYASIYANIDQLQKQLYTGNRMTVLQILENSHESNHESYFSSYRLCNFIKNRTLSQVFLWKRFKIFRTDVFYVTPLDGCC